jgi:ankyrin repeat protein
LEEFLASHVLRVPGATSASASAKQVNGDGPGSLRENRAKAKQFITLNGRAVILKDAFLYTNKGFKTLNQAQLMSDALYYPDIEDAQPWVVYYISKPLVGSPEGLKFLSIPAHDAQLNGASAQTGKPARLALATAVERKVVKSFADLMNQFPMIARQMQPGLERIFNEFKREVEKPLPEIPSSEPSTRPVHRRRSSSASLSSISNSFHSSLTDGLPPIFHSRLELTTEEEDLRHSLEVAITAAIDLFQMVDKQQLSLLGSSTDLTGSMVERMIERYVTEQLHDSILFPRICSIRKTEDAELESRVRQMIDIDISQVGLSTDMSRQDKKELSMRLSKGAELFKKTGVASSPQEMLEIILETQKTITKAEAPRRSSKDMSESVSDPEKHHAIMTINADTLVSLLLIVVIRSPMRHLQARLSYMRHFTFLDDVESGEIGYALSTFEAVLSYLSNDSGGLRRSSLRNRRLWQATKAGNVAEIKEILEPEEKSSLSANNFADPTIPPAISISDTDDGTVPIPSLKEETEHKETAMNGSLAHVFPFERPQTPVSETRPRTKKRVSVQSRSTSISSSYSVRSLALTNGSRLSAFEGDLSIQTLVQTQGSSGESVLMMAVQSQQDKALKYLLNLKDYFPAIVVLDDEDNDGTTLLSAALQTANHSVTDMILDFVLDSTESDKAVREYLWLQDSNGRCAGHYLFNYPGLISRIGDFISWTLKDKNGQTPLFALCRSYDHEEYKWMVENALTSAAKAQRDGLPLRLEDHIDNRGNTLLHIVNDPSLAMILLRECEADVNASNDKQFTPLMVASKYGRSPMVRALFQDPRVDFYARDLRGLTATELAKDDEVRNRIDDLVLLASPVPTTGFDDRITGVVRSFFVEDGSVRFIIKSGVGNPRGLITITTCRRLLSDFEDLAQWLSIEHPASWIPNPAGFLSPFLIPTKPSRSIARDMQLRLDSFLKILLSHPTFSTHEMVWEFFLVPEIEPSVHSERSKRKAELRMETVRDEYEPIIDVREVESFVTFAKESVRSVHSATKSVLRRSNTIRHATLDLFDAATLVKSAFSIFSPLPPSHARALAAYARCLAPTEFPPITEFYYAMQAMSCTSAALLTALSRPSDLITRIASARKTVDRAAASLRRASEKSGWPRPLGLQLLDEARTRAQREAAKKMDAAIEEQLALGRELRYTQQVVAGEMAGWQEERARMGRRACRVLATRMVVVEKERLENLKRMGRIIGMDFDQSIRDGRGKSRISSLDADEGSIQGLPTVAK